MRRLIISCCVMSLMSIGEAHAYVGPGLGLGALGVVLGILISIGLAILAVFWYPLKRVLRKYRTRVDGSSASTVDAPDGGDDAS